MKDEQLLTPVFDITENSVHSDVASNVQGSYEWFYFDARSEDCIWSLVVIWFLGSPFSEYSRKVQLKQNAGPLEHNGLFISLHKYGSLYSYHYSRYSVDSIGFSDGPVKLQIGPSSLFSWEPNSFRLECEDTNANGRTIKLSLVFTALFDPSRSATWLDDNFSKQRGKSNHFWLPVAPMCRVRGRISMSDERNYGQETLNFNGQGYHDHNWGMLPFRPILSWYWARIAIRRTESIIVYDLKGVSGERQSILLHYNDRGLVQYTDDCTVRETRTKAMALMFAPSGLDIVSGDTAIAIRSDRFLEANPFYARAEASAKIVLLSGNNVTSGNGFLELFRPASLGQWLVASAMKARIVIK